MSIEKGLGGGMLKQDLDDNIDETEPEFKVSEVSDLKENQHANTERLRNHPLVP